MGWGKYSPLWTEIDATGRQHVIKFGARRIDMDVYAGPSIKSSKRFVNIQIKPTEYGGAELYVDGKLIKER